MPEGEPKFNPEDKENTEDVEFEDIEQKVHKTEQDKEQLSKKEKTRISRVFKGLDKLAKKVFGEDAVKEVKEAYQENVTDLFGELAKSVKEDGLFVKWNELTPNQKKKIIAYTYRTAIVVGGIGAGAVMAPDEAEAQDFEMATQFSFEPDENGDVDLRIDEAEEEDIEEQEPAKLGAESGITGDTFPVSEGVPASEEIGDIGESTSDTTEEETAPPPPVEKEGEAGSIKTPSEKSAEGADIDSEDSEKQGSGEHKEDEEGETIKTSVESLKLTADHFDFETSDDGKQITVDMEKLAEKDSNLGKLEQILDRFVAGKFTQEFKGESLIEGEDKAKLDHIEAGKVLNMSANTRMIIESKDISFMDSWSAEGDPKISDLTKDLFEYEDNKLVIKDTERYDEVLDILKSHADELAEQNKMDDAIGYTSRIDQETWEDIVRSQETKIQVEDFKENPEVMKYWEAIEERKKSESTALEQQEQEDKVEIPHLSTVEVQGALEESEKQYKEVIGKTLEMNPGFHEDRLQDKLDTAFKEFTEEHSDIDTKDAINDSDYQEAIDKAIPEQEQTALAKIQEFNKPELDKKAHANAMKDILDLDKKLHDKDPLREYADVRESTAHAKLEDELREGFIKVFNRPDSDQLREYTIDLMHEKAGFDSKQGALFVEWFGSQDGKDGLNRTDFERTGIWDKKAEQLDANQLALMADRFMDMMQENASIEELPTDPKSDWKPMTIEIGEGEKANLQSVLVRHLDKGEYEVKWANENAGIDSSRMMKSNFRFVDYETVGVAGEKIEESTKDSEIAHNPKIKLPNISEHTLESELIQNPKITEFLSRDHNPEGKFSDIYKELSKLDNKEDKADLLKQKLGTHDEKLGYASYMLHGIVQDVIDGKRDSKFLQDILVEEVGGDKNYMYEAAEKDEVLESLNKLVKK